MKHNIIFIISLTIALALLAGCSKGAINPTQPDSNMILNLPLGETDEANTSRELISQFEVTFHTDSLKSETTMIRAGKSHMLVGKYIPAPKIAVNSYDPLTGIIDVNVTISNPTPYSARDLRLIVFTDDNGVRLRNPDNWTDLWDIPGGAKINPFKAFAKNESGRIFAGSSQHTERLQVYMPSTPVISFAIDVSFPGNCEEPYQLSNFHQETLFDYANSHADIEIDVYDWQNNANHVQLYCPSITGTDFVDFTKIGVTKWRLNLQNTNEVPQGNYFAAVIASSENTSSKLYEFLSIKVEKSNLPEWTILTYITEDNLGDRIQDDINEMEVVGSVANVLNMVVCWDKDSSSNDVILKIERDPNGYNDTIISPVIDDHDEVIPPGGLPHAKRGPIENFLRWGIREYPAKNYGYIIFGHGNGPFRGSDNPDDFLVVCGGLQIWEVRDLISTVMSEHPEIGKLEFVNLVSCLSAWIELAYCMKDVCKTVIASEWLEYANNFEYAELMNFIVSNHDTIGTFDLASEFVRNYLDNTSESATLCAWDCSKIDTDVIPALNTFSQELINALPNYRSTIAACKTQNGSWGAYCNDPVVKDLGLFAEHISQKSLPLPLVYAAVDLRNTIDSTMIAHGHNPQGSGMCPNNETGWQIWFPENYYDDATLSRRQDYHTIGFDTTLWDDFLGAYQIGEPPIITHAENKITNNTGKANSYHGFTINSLNIYWSEGTWNFSDDATTTEYAMAYIDPASSEFAGYKPYYPSAATVLKYTAPADTYYYPIYYDDTPDGFKCDLGSETLSKGPGHGIIYDQPECDPYPLDIEYSNTLTTTSASIPGWEATYVIEATGHGKVTTQLGTFNCLLLRNFGTNRFNGNITSQFVTYQWIDDQGRLTAYLASSSFDPVTLIPTGYVSGFQIYAGN